MTTETPNERRKAELDALLLKLPGVSARMINGLEAYFVSDKMFACISGNGVGLRLPAAAARELSSRGAMSFLFSRRAWQAPGNGFRSTAPMRPNTKTIFRCSRHRSTSSGMAGRDSGRVQSTRQGLVER